MMKYMMLDTALGELTLVAENDHLVAILHEEEPDKLHLAFPQAEENKKDAFLNKVAAQISDFLEGERTAFDIALKPVGTEFQRQIWQALQAIPYGETVSYTELADHIGNENAVRAAGTACGANPIPLVIPCHRVLSSDGSLGGFRWGLPAKHKLLLLETGSTDAMEAKVA